MSWPPILAAVSLALWLYLLLGRSGFWRVWPRIEDEAPPEPRSWPPLIAVVPARNEAAFVATTLPTLLAQDYPGRFEVLMVDAHSDDGTGEVEAERLDLVSLMVKLRCASVWERFLIPPFVFFFRKLYPFTAVNDPARGLAAAAGGCRPSCSIAPGCAAASCSSWPQTPVCSPRTCWCSGGAPEASGFKRACSTTVGKSALQAGWCGRTRCVSSATSTRRATCTCTFPRGRHRRTGRRRASPSRQRS